MLKNPLLSNLEQKIISQTLILTGCRYNPKSAVEANRLLLARETLETGISYGYKIMIIDSGSPSDFIQEMQTQGVQIIPINSQATLGEQRRVLISEALKQNQEIFVWIESEKIGYIPQIIKTLLPIIHDSVEIVIPKRKSLESYPHYQQYAENFGNSLWKELTGLDLDLWFGPRTWRRDVSNYFLDYHGEYGDKWETFYIPILNAVLEQKKIASIEVDYTNPESQTKIEEHKIAYYFKRLEQLTNITHALTAHWQKYSNKTITPWNG